MKKYLISFMMLATISLFSCEDAGTSIRRLKKPAVVIKIQKDSDDVRFYSLHYYAYIIFEQPDGSFVKLEEGTNVSGIKDYTSIFQVGDTLKDQSKNFKQTTKCSIIIKKQVDTLLDVTNDTTSTIKNDSN